MKIHLSIVALLISLTSHSQDTVFIYDLASHSLTYKLVPPFNPNVVSGSTNPSFGIRGITDLPLQPPDSTYPFSNTSIIQRASDTYSTFNFPFTATALIKYGFNITAAIIGKRTLLVFKYDVRHPGSHWRNLSDANPFFDFGEIQYGHHKLQPVKYYVHNSPDQASLNFAVVEVSENIGDCSGYFGFAFDTAQTNYDSLLLYNISYPKINNNLFYDYEMNGDTLYMKYGFMDNFNHRTFDTYFGGDGEYVSPYFDSSFRIRGIRWSAGENWFLSRNGFYFLKYVVDSLAQKENFRFEINPIRIYPNPVSDWLTIDFQNPSAGDLEIRMYDMRGRKLTEAEYPAGTRQVRLRISDWESGLYSLWVCSGEKIFKERIVKM